LKRFWVFTGKSAAGPYEPGRLKGLPGFGPGTVVAPEGAATEAAWKPARDFPELRALFARPPDGPVPAALSGRAPKPSPARSHPAPRLKSSHPSAAPAGGPGAGPVRRRPAAALFPGRLTWVLAGFLGLVLLAAVLHSVFDRLERGQVPATATPSPAGLQRPMPFEAPGSPLLKKQSPPPVP